MALTKVADLRIGAPGAWEVGEPMSYTLPNLRDDPFSHPITRTRLAPFPTNLSTLSCRLLVIRADNIHSKTTETWQTRTSILCFAL